MGKKEILVLSFSPLHSDPRVYRQIMFLKDKYELIAAGFSAPTVDGVQFVSIEHKLPNLKWKMAAILDLKTGRYEDYYWSMYNVRSAWSKLESVECDLIIANDLLSLPLALELSKKCKAKLFLDAHEFTPREYDNDPIWRFVFQKFWEYICLKYLPHVSAMTSVSRGIADEYSRLYGVECEVITNTPFFNDLVPSQVNGESIRIIHHGGTNPARKLENMIFLIDQLDERFSIDFMLVNNRPRYAVKLERIAQKKPRINFIKPVPFLDIVSTLNKYDIGLFLLDPTAFNYRMALPNKLFEFIQARLVVAIWPSPEMARITEAYDLGVVSDQFSVEAAAGKLNALATEDIVRFKQNAHQAAGMFCAEKNQDKLIGIVEKLIGP